MVAEADLLNMVRDKHLNFSTLPKSSVSELRLTTTTQLRNIGAGSMEDLTFARI